MQLADGDVLAGKYRVDRVLGRGGMGVVVAATHLGLGQRVALKFLLPEYSGAPEIVERFLREARAAAQLRSEHVCRVADVGALDSGAPYIVMELLEGRDLASLLAEQGPIPVPLLADYVVQACAGLAEAHAAGVVHRDLKPANLFLTFRPDGAPLIKLVDFGIAKAPGGTNFQLTQTAAVMGSPGYMSPEQLRSTRNVDARSDIWALGVLLFELASGHPPFTATTITELALRVAMDPTPALTTPGMPRGFEQVVYRCLEKEPARRFADVAQLAAALAPFGPAVTRGRAQGVARVLAARPASVPGGPAISGPSATTTLGSSAASLERAPAARSLRGILLAAVVVGGLAAAAVVMLRGQQRERSQASSQEPARAEAPTPPAAEVPGGPGGVTATGGAGAAGAPATAPLAATRQPAAPPAAAAPASGPAPVHPPAAAPPVAAPLAAAPLAAAPPAAAATSEALVADAAVAVDASVDAGSAVDAKPATPASAPARGRAASPPAPESGTPARPTRPPPVRKVTKPAPSPRAGSDDEDMANSRL